MACSRKAFMTQPSRSLSSALALLVALAPSVALGDATKARCVDANTKAQDSRRDGKLVAAREQLRICVDPSCPSVVRDDCIRRLDEVERAQPTIAFEVKDATGADVSAVVVKMDGNPLAERLTGEALPVDIGEHVFSFVVAGQPPVQRTLLLTEGVKGRRERVELSAASPAPSADTAATAGPNAGTSLLPSAGGSAGAETPDAEGGQKTMQTIGIVLGSVGLAGLAAGSVFGVMALSEKSQQVSDCPNSGACSRDKALNDHSSAVTDGTLSTVGFITGGALLVGGVALFFVGRHSGAPATNGMALVPIVAPGGAGMSLSGAF